MRLLMTVGTIGLGDEQDGFGSSPSSNRTEKVPPAGGDVAPCKQSPRIMIYYAPIAKATRQSRTSPQAFPLPAFCYAFPVLLFLAFCIDRTGRENNRIHKTPSNTNTSAETKEGSKARKHKRKTQRESKKRKQEKQANKTKSKGKRQAYNII